MNPIEKTFDYNSLDTETREFLKQKETGFKARRAYLVIEDGRELLEIKERLGHGLFEQWVNCFLGISIRRAEEYMQIAREFKSADSALLENFQKSTLLLLSSPSTPDSARQEALERAGSGEKLTIKETKKLIETHKQHFDYSDYDAETQEFLKQKTAEIKTTFELAIAKNRIWLTQVREELGEELFREYMKTGFIELIKNFSKEIGLLEDDLFFFAEFFLPEEFREFMPEQTPAT